MVLDEVTDRITVVLYVQHRLVLTEIWVQQNATYLFPYTCTYCTVVQDIVQYLSNLGSSGLFAFGSLLEDL